MKKLLPFFASFFLCSVASAQLSISTAYNYTFYKEAFQRNVPGLQLRIKYLAHEKMGLFLSHTLGAPITEGSMFIANGSNGDIRVNSEIKYKFKTYNLGIYAAIVGGEDTKAS